MVTAIFWGPGIRYRDIARNTQWLLEVADACSGFSTLYATVTVAILTAYFCEHNGRRALILLIAAPLAIGVNIVRVLLLSLLVDWFGLDVLRTSAHEISGLLTFIVALPLVFWLGHSKQSRATS